MSRNVLILGATSGIGRAVAMAMAGDGDNLIVAGRDRDELERIAADLRLRYDVRAVPVEFQALAFETHTAFLESCHRELDGGLDGIVLCYGYMGAQKEAEEDFAEARAMIDANFTSAVSILNLTASYFQKQARGFICGISSVAGDRGRQSNYIYGSSKAGLTAYLQGLRNRLSKSGVSVLTVKPGFVDTSMTFGLPGTFLVASPDAVAARICRAINKKRDSIYVPWFWWGIMTIIKSVPERIFKRLKL